MIENESLVGEIQRINYKSWDVLNTESNWMWSMRIERPGVHHNYDTQH